MSLFTRIPSAGYHPAFSGQVQREYLVVATRPMTVNGLGMNPSDAAVNLAEFKSRVRTLEETVSTAELLTHLVVRHDLKGKRMHDANIVATMLSHGIKNLITANTDDFSCFADIRTLSVPQIQSLLDS